MSKTSLMLMFAMSLLLNIAMIVQTVNNNAEHDAELSMMYSLEDVLYLSRLNDTIVMKYQDIGEIDKRTYYMRGINDAVASLEIHHGLELPEGNQLAMLEVLFFEEFGHLPLEDPVLFTKLEQ